MRATLIHGERDAVLVDTQVTFAQVDALSDWIDSFDKRLVGIYITHGHSDHWIGLSRLKERFPDAATWARPKVHDRAVFEATNPGLSAYWQGIFPNEVPTAPVLPERLEDTSMDLERSELQIIDIGQGDTADSTVVYVPSIAAVGGGDVVYNQVHMMNARRTRTRDGTGSPTSTASPRWTRGSWSPATIALALLPPHDDR
jgi:glyoxylase-like metal-dependent hydrolase (beta-lactamase superfamily II)